MPGPSRWRMRLATATLLPLLFLGGLEMALRVAGYGYPARYFMPRTYDGEDYLVPNPWFSYRFFPPALARAPLPLRMAAEKPGETYRIFLFGESAAYGDPDPSLGVGRYLEVLLEGRFPSTDVEVVCVAMTAINSHVILQIARECAELDGDLWVVYMGNNEMVGPFGAGTVFGARAPNRSAVRAILAVKRTRLGQFLDGSLRRLRGRTTVPEAWGGLEMFDQVRLRHNDPARQRAYRNFEANVHDLLRAGRTAGVPVILSTVAGNLKDCSPFASLHEPELGAADGAEWDRWYRQGKTLEAEGALAAALDAYAKTSALDEDYAELHFRVGTCLLGLSRQEEAREAFVRAQDYDALPVRADGRINGILREAAGRWADSGVVVADAVQALDDGSPHGIAGREMLYEHVHFTLAGNYQLARCFAEAVAPQLASAATAGGEEDWLAPEECGSRLAATLWDQHRLWHRMLDRIDKAPFLSQSSHADNVSYLEARRKGVIARMEPDTPQADRLLYEQALANAPDDTLLLARYGQYLEATGARSEAIRQFVRVCELLPDLEWPHYYLGDVLARAGNYQEAAASLERALEIRSDFTQAHEALRELRLRYGGEL